MMKNRTMVVRVIAIVLCALMVFGVVAGAVSILAHGAYVDTEQAAAAVQTGSNNRDTNMPLILGVGAALLLAFCIIVPRLRKKPEAPPAPAQEEKPAEPEQPENEDKE